MTTDATGLDHYPTRSGGPAFATTCYVDGEPWPCELARADGAEAIEAAPGTVDTSAAGATAEGTHPGSITVEGDVTAEGAIAAGISRDAAARFDAAATTVESPAPKAPRRTARSAEAKARDNAKRRARRSASR